MVVFLALRGVSANFTAGIILQTRHPINVGDDIEFDEFHGVVQELNGRSVVLTVEGVEAVVLDAVDSIDAVLSEPPARMICITVEPGRVTPMSPSLPRHHSDRDGCLRGSEIDHVRRDQLDLQVGQIDSLRRELLLQRRGLGNGKRSGDSDDHTSDVSVVHVDEVPTHLIRPALRHGVDRAVAEGGRGR
ncbi:mechanosensitive ion channel domain-containing protein [Herbiconiux sp.]|uniref:mechanosensitive ion channel domain-containing protein n=1 Tax=Herbiconiux sp. TaxID=1871186 RepID=UPI003450E698